MQSTYDIGYQLQHVAALLEKQSDQVLQEQLGIGFSQFKILRTLQAEPRTTQREIAYNLAQTEASISRQVKLMVADGMLQSVRSTKDHREHLTLPTPKGERVAEAACNVLDKYFYPVFASLSSKQLQQLEVALTALHSQVCQVAHPNAAEFAART